MSSKADKTNIKQPNSNHQVSTWQNFKRLMAYAKMYKSAGLFAIVCMLGYAAIDVYFLSKLPKLIIG